MTLRNLNWVFAGFLVLAASGCELGFDREAMRLAYQPGNHAGVGTPTPVKPVAVDLPVPPTRTQPLVAPSPVVEPAPAESGTSVVNAVRHGAIGSRCSGSRSGQICLGIKLVALRDANGDPVASESDAILETEDVNTVWKECGIQFQIDEFFSVESGSRSSIRRVGSYRDFDRLRKGFASQDKLLIVATPRWDRSGSLAGSGANAWTNLPGEDVYGVVIEHPSRAAPNSTQSLLLAHELGHYLSLGHEQDASRLMNPVIYRNSTALSESDCRAARWAAKTYWKKMFR